MVAAGMLGVISLGVTQLMQNSAKTEKRLGQQINIVSLEAEIGEALRNPVGCGRTLNSGDTNITGTPTVDMGRTWTDVPDGRIYRANNPDNLSDNKASWGTVVEKWVDPAQKVGVYGDGSNMVSVLNIQYRGFYNNIDNQFGLGTNYNAGTANLEPITGAPSDSIGTVVVKVDFTRGNYGRFSTLGAAAQQELSNKLTTGPFRVSRFYKVRVRIDTASQNLIRCLTANDDVIDAYCNAMGGFLDGDGQCKNIKITDTETAPLGTAPGQDNGWAIAATNRGVTTAGGNLLAENHLAVGYDDDGTDTRITGVTYNGAGNSTGTTTGLVTGATLGSGDILAKNNITADQNIFAQRALNVGAPATPATAYGDGAFARDLNIYRDNYVTRDQSVGRALNVGAPVDTATVAGDVAIARDLQIERGVNIGTSGGAGITTKANAAGTLLVRSRITVGQATADATSSFRVGSGESQFVNGTNRRTVINSLTGSAHMQIYNSATKEILRINNNGQIVMEDVETTGDSIIIGVDRPEAGYRAIRIRNQPITTSTMTFSETTGEDRWEVPTKLWVRKMIFGQLSSNPTLVADVVNNIVDYAQHNQLETIRANMCNSITLNTFSQTSGCSYNTGTRTCTCVNSNCSNTGSGTLGQQNCGTIESTGALIASTFMRAPAIYTTGSANPGVGNMGTSALYASSFVNSAGYIYANSYITTNAYLTTRGNITAGGVTGSTGANIYAKRSTVGGNIIADLDVGAGRRVCAEGATGLTNCYTKFGKHMCTNGGFMIGIAYGHPVCAKIPGGATVPQRF